MSMCYPADTTHMNFKSFDPVEDNSSIIWSTSQKKTPKCPREYPSLYCYFPWNPYIIWVNTLWSLAEVLRCLYPIPWMETCANSHAIETLKTGHMAHAARKCVATRKLQQALHCVLYWRIFPRETQFRVVTICFSPTCNSTGFVAYCFTDFSVPHSKWVTTSSLYHLLTLP